MSDDSTKKEVPEVESMVVIQADALQAALNILQTLPFNQVYQVIPALMQARPAEGPSTG